MVPNKKMPAVNNSYCLYCYSYCYSVSQKIFAEFMLQILSRNTCFMYAWSRIS